MVAFIHDHRNLYGVEPICKVIPIAPSTYYAYKARERDASLCSAHAKPDAEFRVAIKRVWETSFGVYGVRKVCHQLRRDGVEVARCILVRIARTGCGSQT